MRFGIRINSRSLSSKLHLMIDRDARKKASRYLTHKRQRSNKKNIKNHTRTFFYCLTLLFCKWVACFFFVPARWWISQCKTQKKGKTLERANDGGKKVNMIKFIVRALQRKLLFWFLLFSLLAHFRVIFGHKTATSPRRQATLLMLQCEWWTGCDSRSSLARKKKKMRNLHDMQDGVRGRSVTVQCLVYHIYGSLQGRRGKSVQVDLASV